MSTQTELRQEITNRIIESLKSGNLPPWRPSWSSHINAGSPTNVVSKKRYSGVNPMLLRIAAARHALKSKYWATFNQWKDLGGKVMRRPDHVPSGEWGTSIVFFKPIRIGRAVRWSFEVLKKWIEAGCPREPSSVPPEQEPDSPKV